MRNEQPNVNVRKTQSAIVRDIPNSKIETDLQGVMHHHRMQTARTQERDERERGVKQI